MINLPPGWARCTIGQIAELENGRAFKPGEWEQIGLPIVRIQNLNDLNSAYNYYSGPVADRHIIQAGDLLYAWSGTPGTSFGAHIWRGPKAVLNQHIFAVRVDPNLINREFLCLALNASIDSQIAKAHGGAGLRHVTKKAFEATEIALPPLQEQKRIVSRYRALQERIAAALLSLDSAEGSAKLGQEALLESVYTLSLLPDERRSKYSPHAKMVSVAEVTTDLAYGSSAKSAPVGKVPVLRMGNIQGGELDWSNLVYTSDDAEIKKYLLEPGDVLFNRTNSPELVGKTAVFKSDRQAIFAGYLIRARCSDQMMPEFLAYCLNSPAGRRYSQAVKSDGVSQSNINAKKLAGFTLPCPDMDDQRVLVGLVTTGRERLSSIGNEIARIRELLSGLERRMIGLAVSGGMGTGDPDDQPAGVYIDLLTADKAKRRLQPPKTPVGIPMTKKSVAEILAEAGDWTHAQDVARNYGIVFGSSSAEVEPFYAELRALEAAGMLITEPLSDKNGQKIGERLRLRVPS